MFLKLILFLQGKIKQNHNIKLKKIAKEIAIIFFFWYDNMVRNQKGSGKIFKEREKKQ